MQEDITYASIDSIAKRVGLTSMLIGRYDDRTWKENSQYDLQTHLRKKEEWHLLMEELYKQRTKFKNIYKLNPMDLKVRNPPNSFIAKPNGEYVRMIAAIFEGQVYFLKPLKKYPKIRGIPREAYVMSRLRHENIAKSIGYIKIKKNEKFLALECLPLVLDKYLEKNLSIKQKLYIIIEIGRGLCFLHMKNTVFLNLSPWSINVDQDGKPKLFDFELCTNLKMEPPEKFYKESSFASPEAMMGCRDILGDIYSYGLLAYYILTKNLYCEYIGLEGLDDNSDYFSDYENKSVIDGLRNLIERMIDPISVERPTAEECYIEFKRLNNI
ncbi:unnamed protein product [Blepharisma stoltei]|uniref:Protein kinase domain-containing protein n=1 Tax=Blepharisma stoltei TaxID=1481888 RepID=A0AAU9J891_9CILI|nr:unnamed protein product [Blepharisma stoltei]